MHGPSRSGGAAGLARPSPSVRPPTGRRPAVSCRENHVCPGVDMDASVSAGAGFRAALTAESPLQVMGAITAYAGLMARRTGYKALYLSGGGVAANSLGMPDLGISTMEDVLIEERRSVDAPGMPLLVRWGERRGGKRVSGR